jgi:hypothetical protein
MSFLLQDRVSAGGMALSGRESTGDASAFAERFFDRKWEASHLDGG